MAYKIVKEGEIEVGDVVHSKTAFGTNKFLITRVTKRKALSKRESDGHEYTFQRKIGINLSYPRVIWNMTEYTVYRKDEN